MVRTLPLLTTLVYGTKFMTCFLNAEKIKSILMNMKSHSDLLSTENEFNEFLKYCQRGRECTKIYVGYVFFTTCLYVFMPLVPCLLDQIHPLNETRERVFIYELDYGFDNNEDYFYIIQLHIYITAYVKISSGFNFDVLFFLFTQHACGYFAALGQKLENLDKKIPKEKHSIEKEYDIVHQEISTCVQRHCTGLEFLSVIESLFAISFLIQILITVVIISLIGILVIMNLDKPHEAVRFVLFVVAHSFSLFYVSLSSQRLTDKISLLFKNVYFCRWYELPIKSRKMILQILTKTKYTYKITALQIYSIEIESFSVMIRASMSYFTMLSSMR
ncbi:odorant receptor 13a-like isoform X2 [Leptopilina heterotoma]|nr:odorant receptor 13a-like isoform X2 [Leptopilina heterotoma]